METQLYVMDVLDIARGKVEEIPLPKGISRADAAKLKRYNCFAEKCKNCVFFSICWYSRCGYVCSESKCNQFEL